jgi:hypothetical protein
MDATCMLLYGGDCLPAMSGFHGLVSRPGEHPASQAPHSLFVVDHEDGVSSRRTFFGTSLARRRDPILMHWAKVPCGDLDWQAPITVM